MQGKTVKYIAMMILFFCMAATSYTHLLASSKTIRGNEMNEGMSLATGPGHTINSNMADDCWLGTSNFDLSAHESIPTTGRSHPSFNQRATLPQEADSLTITFRIHDGTNAIAQALVNVNGTNYITDVNGEVRITGLPSGMYTYIIEAPGFKKVKGTVTLADKGVEITERLPILNPGPGTPQFSGVEYYPNPFSDFLIMSIPMGLTVTSIEIRSESGNLFYATSLDFGSIEVCSVASEINNANHPVQEKCLSDLPINSLPSGGLIIRAFNNGKLVSVDRIVKD